MGRYCVVVRGEDGQVLARVQLDGKPTAEEEAAIVAMFRAAAGEPAGQPVERERTEK